MDYATEATTPTTDADHATSREEDDWIIEIYKPAVGGRPKTVTKDLSREEDIREILEWMNTTGWIVLKIIGDAAHDWDLAQDRVSPAAALPSSSSSRREGGLTCTWA